jgi:DNA-binding NarL/FixJ family response regulator
MHAIELPVGVAAVNDFELVVAGVARLLEQFPDRLKVRDRLIIGEPIEQPVDVALYDTYGRAGIALPALRVLANTPEVRYVALFSLDIGPDLVAEGRSAGASGFISKALTGDEIADAIVRVASGEPIVAATVSPGPISDHLDWPGRDADLTERESEVLAFVAQGLSNREIAAALYLSSETIKSYVARVFAKLGLRNRVEAANYVAQSQAFARHSGASASR